MPFLRFSALAATILTLSLGLTPTEAMARHNQWSDPIRNIVLTFPDTWRADQAVSGDGYHRLSLTLPEPSGATCRLAVADETRFSIYQKHQLRAVMAAEWGTDFWEGLTASLDDRFFHFFNEGGMSHGDAHYTVVDFTVTENDTGALRARRALIYVSLYGDQQTMIACDAVRDRYPDYASAFLDLVQGAQFAPRYHALRHGHYRDFLETDNDGVREEDGSLWDRTLDILHLRKWAPKAFDKQHRERP